MAQDENAETHAGERTADYVAGDLIAEKYRLERPLGEGGMGTVWLATNVTLDTEVAIKLIRAEVQGAEASARLLQEARAAAKLGHRAIVRIFDFGETDSGDPFLVMELLEGESLAQIIDRRRRLSAAHAVQTLLPVIDALSRAHERGIVHRDLKPDNIFVAREAGRVQPKVVDFGIAKLEQRALGKNLTQAGTVLGSPGYMAPEQARGLSDVDARADTWAVCVVLYEAITGQAAFEGDNYNSLMRAIIEAPVAPMMDFSAGDAALWALLERGLKKDRSERWDTVRELGIGLALWLLARGIDRDITGEALDTVWLSDDSAKRDLYSAPPPSSEAALSLGRRSFSSLPDTLAGPLLHSDAPGLRRSSPPESTSAHVCSASRPPRKRASLVAAAGIAAVVLVGAGTIWLAPTSSGSNAGRASSAHQSIHALTPEQEKGPAPAARPAERESRAAPPSSADPPSNISNGSDPPPPIEPSEDSAGKEKPARTGHDEPSAEKPRGTLTAKPKSKAVDRPPKTRRPAKGPTKRTPAPSKPRGEPKPRSAEPLPADEELDLKDPFG